MAKFMKNNMPYLDRPFASKLKESAWVLQQVPVNLGSEARNDFNRLSDADKAIPQLVASMCANIIANARPADQMLREGVLSEFVGALDDSEGGGRRPQGLQRQPRRERPAGGGRDGGRNGGRNENRNGGRRNGGRNNNHSDGGQRNGGRNGGQRKYPSRNNHNNRSRNDGRGGQRNGGGERNGGQEGQRNNQHKSKGQRNYSRGQQ